MISTSNLWTYVLPSLAAILLAGLVLPSSVPHGPGVHRAPRGFIPSAAARPARFIDTPGASLDQGGIGDVVRVPADVATLDPDPDSPEAWLAHWDDAHTPAHVGVPYRTDEQFLDVLDRVTLDLRTVADDLIEAILTPGEVGLFTWRIDTPTGNLPLVDTPAAQTMAAALLEA